MNVAVTGPTGHVGGNLIRALLNEGHRVTALVYRDGPALANVDIRRVQGDVLDPASLRSAFSDAEVVFHLAAQITLVRDRNGFVRRINVDGTRNVIDACTDCGVRRLVHFSSIHALSPYPSGDSIDEDRPVAEAPYLADYDRTKSEAEQLVWDAVRDGMDAVVLTPTGVIGPHDYELSRMGQVFLDLYRRRLRALVGGGFNWVDVRDVCDGAIAAATRGTRGSRYILSGRWLSVSDLVAQFAEVAKVPAPRIVIPRWLSRSVAAVAALQGRVVGAEPRLAPAALNALRHHQHVMNVRTREALGYRTRPIRETLEDTLSWFYTEGLIPR